MASYRGCGSAGGLGTAGGFVPPPGGMEDTPVEEPDAVYTLSKTFDPRMVPTKQRYAAPIGAQASTSVNVQLTQVNTTTHTFPITPPSPGVVIQKNIMYDLQAYVQFTASHVNTLSFGTAWPRYGIDFAIAACNPINRLVSNWQITVNNQTVQFQNIGSQDLMFLVENSSTRPARDCNYRTPLYTNWDDAYGTTFALGDIGDYQGQGDVPPGAYDVSFALPGTPNIYALQASGGVAVWQPITGVPASFGSSQQNSVVLLEDVAKAALATYPNTLALVYDTNVLVPNPAAAPNPVNIPSPTAVGISLGNSNGYPAGMSSTAWQTLNTASSPNYPVNTTTPPAGVPYIWNPATTTALPFALYARVIDPIQCPPFSFGAETAFGSQGMWGVNNALVIAQLTDPGVSRWLQGTTKGGMTSLTYTSWQTVNAQLWMQYLTPPQTPQTLLPSRCVLPMLYKQYTQFSPTDVIQPGQTFSLQLPAYTFSTVSNFLVISVRPAPQTSNQYPFNECDFCLSFPDNPFTQFQYSNMSGLLSNMSKQQLVGICRQNGVQASVSQFGGLSGGRNSGYVNKGGMKVGAGGAILVLKPGVDFPLPLGTAAGTSGMVQIQFTLQVKNQGLRATSVIITTQSLSTSYFINDNGAAKQMLVGLDEEELLKAPFGPEGSTAHQLIGGGAWDTIKNIGSKLWDNRQTIMDIARAGARAFGYTIPPIAGMGMAGGAGAGQKRVRGGGGGSEQGSLLAALAS